MGRGRLTGIALDSMKGQGSEVAQGRQAVQHSAWHEIGWWLSGSIGSQWCGALQSVPCSAGQGDPWVTRHSQEACIGQPPDSA